jgi:energy-converting hydrogenase A subunit M
MAASKQSDSQPKGFGKAPYRKYTCKPSAALANQLKDAVDELYAWLIKNSKSSNLDFLGGRIENAARELASKDYQSSIASCANLLVDVMQEIRDRRKEDDEGQVDY